MDLQGFTTIDEVGEEDMTEVRKNSLNASEEIDYLSKIISDIENKKKYINHLDVLNDSYMNSDKNLSSGDFTFEQSKCMGESKENLYSKSVNLNYTAESNKQINCNIKKSSDLIRTFEKNTDNFYSKLNPQLKKCSIRITNLNISGDNLITNLDFEMNKSSPKNANNKCSRRKLNSESSDCVNLSLPASLPVNLNLVKIEPPDEEITETFFEDPAENCDLTNYRAEDELPLSQCIENDFEAQFLPIPKPIITKFDDEDIIKTENPALTVHLNNLNCVSSKRYKIKKGWTYNKEQLNSAIIMSQATNSSIIKMAMFQNIGHNFPIVKLLNLEKFSIHNMTFGDYDIVNVFFNNFGKNLNKWKEIFVTKKKSSVGTCYNKIVKKGKILESSSSKTKASFKGIKSRLKVSKALNKEPRKIQIKNLKEKYEKVLNRSRQKTESPDSDKFSGFQEKATDDSDKLKKPKNNENEGDGFINLKDIKNVSHIKTKNVSIKSTSSPDKTTQFSKSTKYKSAEFVNVSKSSSESDSGVFEINKPLIGDKAEKVSNLHVEKLVTKSENLDANTNSKISDINKINGSAKYLEKIENKDEFEDILSSLKINSADDDFEFSNQEKLFKDKTLNTPKRIKVEKKLDSKVDIKDEPVCKSSSSILFKNFKLEKEKTIKKLSETIPNDNKNEIENVPHSEKLIQKSTSKKTVENSQLSEESKKVKFKTYEKIFSVKLNKFSSKSDLYRYARLKKFRIILKDIYFSKKYHKKIRKDKKFWDVLHKQKQFFKSKIKSEKSKIREELESNEKRKDQTCDENKLDQENLHRKLKEKCKIGENLNKSLKAENFDKPIKSSDKLKYLQEKVVAKTNKKNVQSKGKTDENPKVIFENKKAEPVILKSFKIPKKSLFGSSEKDVARGLLLSKVEKSLLEQEKYNKSYNRKNYKKPSDLKSNLDKNKKNDESDSSSCSFGNKGPRLQTNNLISGQKSNVLLNFDPDLMVQKYREEKEQWIKDPLKLSSMDVQEESPSKILFNTARENILAVKPKSQNISCLLNNENMLTGPKQVGEWKRVDGTKQIEEWERVDGTKQIGEWKRVDDTKQIGELERVDGTKQIGKWERVDGTKQIKDWERVDGTKQIGEWERVDGTKQIGEWERVDGTKQIGEWERVEGTKQVGEWERVDDTKQIGEWERVEVSPTFESKDIGFSPMSLNSDYTNSQVASTCRELIGEIHQISVVVNSSEPASLTDLNCKINKFEPNNLVQLNQNSTQESFVRTTKKSDLKYFENYRNIKMSEFNNRFQELDKRATNKLYYMYKRIYQSTKIRFSKLAGDMYDNKAKGALYKELKHIKGLFNTLKSLLFEEKVQQEKENREAYRKDPFNHPISYSPPPNPSKFVKSLDYKNDVQSTANFRMNDPYSPSDAFQNFSSSFSPNTTKNSRPSSQDSVFSVRGKNGDFGPQWEKESDLEADDESSFPFVPVNAHSSFLDQGTSHSQMLESQMDDKLETKSSPKKSKDNNHNQVENFGPDNSKKVCNELKDIGTIDPLTKIEAASSKREMTNPSPPPMSDYLLSRVHGKPHPIGLPGVVSDINAPLHPVGSSSKFFTIPNRMGIPARVPSSSPKIRNLSERKRFTTFPTEYLSEGPRQTESENQFVQLPKRPKKDISIIQPLRLELIQGEPIFSESCIRQGLKRKRWREEWESKLASLKKSKREAVPPILYPNEWEDLPSPPSTSSPSADSATTSKQEAVPPILYPNEWEDLPSPTFTPSPSAATSKQEAVPPILYPNEWEDFPSPTFTPSPSAATRGKEIFNEKQIRRSFRTKENRLRLREERENKLRLREERENKRSSLMEIEQEATPPVFYPNEWEDLSPPTYISSRASPLEDTVEENRLTNNHVELTNEKRHSIRLMVEKIKQMVNPPICHSNEWENIPSPTNTLSPSAATLQDTVEENRLTNNHVELTNEKRHSIRLMVEKIKQEVTPPICYSNKWENVPSTYKLSPSAATLEEATVEESRPTNDHVRLVNEQQHTKESFQLMVEKIYQEKNQLVGRSKIRTKLTKRLRQKLKKRRLSAELARKHASLMKSEEEATSPISYSNESEDIIPPTPTSLILPSADKSEENAASPINYSKESEDMPPTSLILPSTDKIDLSEMDLQNFTTIDEVGEEDMTELEDTVEENRRNNHVELTKENKHAIDLMVEQIFQEGNQLVSRIKIRKKLTRNIRNQLRKHQLRAELERKRTSLMKVEEVTVDENRLTNNVELTNEQDTIVASLLEVEKIYYEKKQLVSRSEIRGRLNHCRRRNLKKQQLRPELRRELRSIKIEEEATPINYTNESEDVSPTSLMLPSTDKSEENAASPINYSNESEDMPPTSLILPSTDKSEENAASLINYSNESEDVPPTSLILPSTDKLEEVTVEESRLKNDHVRLVNDQQFTKESFRLMVEKIYQEKGQRVSRHKIRKRLRRCRKRQLLRRERDSLMKVEKLTVEENQRTNYHALPSNELTVEENQRTNYRALPSNELTVEENQRTNYRALPSNELMVEENQRTNYRALPSNELTVEENQRTNYRALPSNELTVEENQRTNYRALPSNELTVEENQRTNYRALPSNELTVEENQRTNYRALPSNELTVEENQRTNYRALPSNELTVEENQRTNYRAYIIPSNEQEQNTTTSEHLKLQFTTTSEHLKQNTTTNEHLKQLTIEKVQFPNEGERQTSGERVLPWERMN